MDHDDDDGTGAVDGAISGRSRSRSYGSADPAESASAAPAANGTKRQQAMSPLSIGPDSPIIGNGSDRDCNDGVAADNWLDDSSRTRDASNQQQSTATAISESRMRILFGIMGCGTLFPYNAIITCVDYYAELLPDVEDVAGQLAASCLTALLVTTVLLLPLSTPADTCTRAATATPTAMIPRTYRGYLGCTCTYITTIFASPIRRIYIGYVLCLLSLLLLAALRQPTIRALNLASFLVGMADATSQSGLYVYAASFHRPSYTAAVTFGSAIAGLAVGILRLMTRGIFDTSTLDGLATGVSLLYIISAGVIGICIWALFVVVRGTGVVQIREASTSTIEQEVDAATENGSNTKLGTAANGHVVSRRSCCCRIIHHPRFVVYLQTIRVTWKPTLAAFLNFFITLSLFPGTVSSIESVPYSVVSLGDWLPVVLITTFNAADCVGRGALNIDRLGVARLLLSKRDAVQSVDGDGESIGRTEGRVLLPNLDVLVWYHCFARVIFYPLFAFCMLPTSPHPLVTSDLLRILLVFLFGFSNGFVNCAAFMVSPTMVKGERHRDASSLLLLLSIYSGLTLGSYFGLAVDLMLRSIGKN